MLSLLNASFFEQYGLLIVLTVALAILLFINFNNRKKNDAARVSLNDQLVPGTKVKTYGGIYGTIISIEETTDGKIVLLASGDDKRVSYQQIHINAIYGLDEKKPVVLNANGEQVFNDVVDLDKLEAERTAQKAEETKAEVKSEPKAEEKPKTTRKKASK